MSDLDDKLREILDNHALVYARTAKQFIMSEISEEELLTQQTASDGASEQAIKQWVNEVIGANTPLRSTDEVAAWKHAQNQLRAEQRKRAGL